MQLSIGDLMYATAGSAALEPATDRPLTLSPKVECHKITTGGYGLLPSGTVGIILGRSRLVSQRGDYPNTGLPKQAGEI